MFYDKYAHICKQRGISMSAAALGAGLSKSLVTKWKANKVDVPSPDVLKKLSAYFDIPVSELLEEEEKENPTVNDTGTLYQNIMSLCERRGIKGGKMCTDIGISKSLMTDLKMGRKTGVSAVTAQKIANYFGVSVGYLLGEEEKENPTVKDDGLSEGKRELIDMIKKLPEDQVPFYRQILSVPVKSGQSAYVVFEFKQTEEKT